MFQLLNRITWLLSMIAGLSIMLIDEDLFFPGLVLGVIIKYVVFSPTYIRSRLVFFKQQVLKDTTNQEVKKQNELSESSSKESSWNDDSYENASSNEVFADTTVSMPMDETPVEKSQAKIETPREPNIFEKFFAENVLAKIGGIIVFIGVLFFLSAIYVSIGPVGKIVIGFLLGFSFYGVGTILDKKGFEAESRIVMGLGILINYLVILSGRFLLGDDSSIENSFLSVGTTFIFLILNTVFAVTTALVYNSRSLLIFSFVFAYLNPLLLGTSSSEPYTLLGYALIVTLGAMFLSYTKKEFILFILSFILAAFLFLIAPYMDANGWITKLICINILGAISLYTSTVFEQKSKNLSEILIGGIFFLIGLMGLLSLSSLNEIQLLILGVSSLGLMLFCYISSNRGAYLYSIGTLGTILTLSPALYTNGLEAGMFMISLSIIIVFAVMNIGYVLSIGNKMLSENISNIIGGLVSGALFLTYMIYFFGGEYFPGIAQGFAYVLLAAIYASLGFMFVKKVGIQEMQKNPGYENTFYSISALALSLFSLAIAFVFAEQKEIISIVWILESSVLFFLFKKIDSLKILAAAMILYIIGVMRIVPFLDTNLSGNIGLLVTCIIILAAIFTNLVCLMRTHNMGNLENIPAKYFHHAIHIFAILIVTTMIHEIIAPESEWVSLFYFTAVIVVLGIIYRKLQETILTIFSNIALVGIYIVHILALLIAIGGGIFGIFELNIGISLCILLLPLFIYGVEYMKFWKIRSKYLGAITLLYYFIATTLYISYYFDGTFAITMYWGALAFIVMAFGISKNLLPLRTIGLYLVSITVIKIFLHDIWQSELSGGLGYLVFMVTGVLMIILSTMYTKKFGNTLNKDFSPRNLFSTDVHDSSNEKKQNTKNTIMTDISKIDISGIKGVRIIIHGNEKAIQIRAENLTKIAKLITSSHQKKEFAAGELQNTYKLITENYKSQLTPAQYTKIKDIVEQFVKHGGNIEFVTE